jgi:hypothetical protein
VGYAPLVAAPTTDTTPAPSAFTISHTDWVINSIVCFKTGPKAGSFGVLQSTASSDGYFKVSLRNPAGTLVPGELINSHYSQLKIAEPTTIGVQLYVLAGKNKGITGTLKRTIGKDIAFHRSGSETAELIKLAAVAWLHT